jgi:sugar lactone lactonase YvrE
MKNIVTILLFSLFAISTAFSQNIYTTTRGVDIFNAELEQTRQIVEPSINFPTGLFVDLQSEKIYWGDSNNFTVMSGNMDGSEVEGLQNIFELNFFEVFDVFVDTSSQKIFFSGYAPSYADLKPGIYSMNLDGSEMRIIYATDSDFSNAPRAIAPDSNLNNLLIAEGSSVKRISIGQSKSKKTLKAISSTIMGIDYDSVNDKIYVLMESELIRMNSDFSGLEVLADSGYTSGNHVKVDETNRKVYWTSSADFGEREFGKIFEANLDGSEQRAIYVKEFISPYGLFIDEENGDFYVSMTERFGIPRIQKMRLNQDDRLTTVEVPINTLNSGATDPDQIVADSKNQWIYWLNNASNKNYASNLGQQYYIQRIGFGDNTAKLEVIRSSIRFKESEDAILDFDINEEEEHLYLAIDAPSDFDQLIQYDIRSGKADTLISREPSLSKIQSVAFDASTNSLFYTIYFRNDSTSFRKLNLNDMTSTHLSVVNDAAIANNINYSEANQMLYFHHRGESTIYRMNIENGFKEAVITSNGNGFFDLSNDHIYWTDTRETKRSGLDGNNTEAFNTEFGLRSHFVVIDESDINVSNELIKEQPNDLQLMQNYPNPFNPTTNIEFYLPTQSLISLKIYNLLGQTVATVFEGRKSSGQHQVRFDATSLSSGVYFYQLSAGNYSVTKKLTLIK